MRHLNETAVQSIAQVMFPFPAGEHLLGRQRVRPLALIPWAMLAENACAVDFGQRKRPRRVLRGFDGGRFSSHLCSGGLHKVRVVCACARCVVSSADHVAVRARAQFVETYAIVPATSKSSVASGLGKHAPWIPLAQQLGR